MRPAMRWGATLLAFATAAGCRFGERIEGRYVADDAAGLTLTLSESRDGRLTGTMAGPAASVPLVGQRQGDGFAGTVGERDESEPFTASLDDERLTLVIGPAENGQAVHFHRGD